MTDEKLSYARALEIAHDDMGIYPQAVITEGVRKERTEWQNGWNAYAMALNDKASKVMHFYSSLPVDLQPVIEGLLSHEKLSLMLRDGEDPQFLVPCNDLFYWACADAEEISVEELLAFNGALQESPNHGELLWACRKRGMRPQKPYYKYFSEGERLLFDACGPERVDRL